MTLPTSDTITFQLLAELESYETTVLGLARDWQATPELVLFGEVGKAMERMRALVGALPVVSPHWMMVVISHAEMMHNLWRLSRGEAVELGAEVREHLACVTAMTASCRSCLAQAGHAVH